MKRQMLENHLLEQRQKRCNIPQQMNRHLYEGMELYK